MPNWCYNRITVYGSEESEAKLKEIEEIFEKENPFNEIYPIPDFKNIPNEKGELPKLEQVKNPDGSIFYETYNFPDGKNDDRWYEWNITNWGTKWDITANQVEFGYEDSEQLEMEFDTAWSPPEEICFRLREMFQDLTFTWFYDEPGMCVAGYL